MKSIVLNPVNNKNLDNLSSLFDEYTTFYFKPGNYYLSEQLNIEHDNICFNGLSSNTSDVHIFQSGEKNGINVTGKNFNMTYISIHVNKGIALTIANTCWSLIEYCHFFGGEDTFTIYYAGKRYNTGNIFEEFEKVNMDNNNQFNYNIVYSKWSGDSVSFSLQYNGSVRNNIIRGGKIAIYMCRDCIINNNKIYDSTSHGIICSLPSKNITITNNFIRDCTDAGIGVKMQVEHGEYHIENHNISIKNNTVNDTKSIGIEINDGDDINISNNCLFWTQNTGIYLLKTTKCIIENNVLSHFDVGILIDIKCNENVIKSNRLYSVYPDVSKHCIFMESDTNANIISNNKVSGECTSGRIKSLGLNNESNNIENEYHTYGEEAAMIY